MLHIVSLSEARRTAMFQMKAGVENPIAKYGISKHAAFDIFDDPCLSKFGTLHGMQITGLAELVEPFSDTYNAHAAWKNIPLETLRKLSSPMHLIRVRPTRIECLFSDFKELGGSPRQTLLLDESER